MAEAPPRSVARSSSSERHASSSPRAAVIGAGFGGLAAAVRLQAAGIQTTLFEARDKPGGRAYVYRDQGFTFDAGPTVMTAPSCLEELFALGSKTLGDFVELIPNDPFYRILWGDGDRFDYHGDPAKLLAEVQRRAPEDVAGYERFYDYSRRVYAAGYVGLVAQPFLRLWDMARVLPQLLRLRADRSVYRSVSRYVKDDRLRQVLSFNSLLVGGSPFETSSIYTLIHYLEREEGVWFVRGGTGALVAALVRLFEELGGELRTSSPVRSVRVDELSPQPVHRVTSDARGSEPFDLVVSNADVHHTYARLYGEDPRAAKRARQLERMDWSMSAFLIFFGTDCQFPDLAHHNVILGPRYKELIDDIFHGPGLPDDFSIYLHAPTVSDASLAPEGCSTFYALSPVPHLGSAKVDWPTVGRAYGERILEYLERFLPDLRRHIVTKRTFTPNDFASELAAYQGAAFSIAPTLLQSAWFRPHNRDPKIPGLYLVGAGTHPGAGVPGVVNSATATVSTILADLGR